MSGCHCMACTSYPEIVCRIKRFEEAIEWWKKDKEYRKSNEGKTEEEIYPLSIGYSPYSGLEPLKEPQWINFRHSADQGE